MLIPFKIEQIIAKIGGTADFPFLLAKVAFGNYPARLDLRRWKVEKGEYAPLKGVVLSNEEVARLRDALDSLPISDEGQHHDQDTHNINDAERKNNKQC